MKLLLINPPRHNEIVADNPTFIDEERGHNPPLGLLYLASYIKQNSNHQVYVLDAQVDCLGYDDDFLKRIEDIGPDVVGVSAMTFTLIDVLKTIKLVQKVSKKFDRKIITVLGGSHPHLYPEETICLENIDFVVKGEGEVSFLKLLEALDGNGNFSEIKGLVYRKDGQIFNNPVGDLNENLDGLPFPDRELLPVNKYNSLLGAGRIVTTMITSRGCPFQCSFCNRPHLGKRFRYHSALRVVDEMEACIKMGIEEILIYDDTFTINRQRVLDVCSEINKRNLKFIWDIRARVDTVDAEVLKALMSAGCTRIHFGVEAGTEKILRVLNKGIHLDQIEKTFKIAKELGFEILGYFIIGAPEETKEDILATIKFAKKLNPDYVHITILTPYPATEIYARALKEGVIDHDYYLEFARHPENGVEIRYWDKELSKQELFGLLGRFYREFYGRPSYILKQLLKIRSVKDLLKKARAGYKILR
ncbi:MAG: radical SAM protein [Candidatus Buchananbacteria bacterium]